MSAPMFFYEKNLPYLQHLLIVSLLRVADGWQIWQIFCYYLRFPARYTVPCYFIFCVFSRDTPFLVLHGDVADRACW